MLSCQPLPPAPLPLLHVQADGLTERLADGAVLLLHYMPQLAGHLRGQGEGDVSVFLGLTGTVSLFAWCSSTLSYSYHLSSATLTTRLRRRLDLQGERQAL